MQWAKDKKNSKEIKNNCFKIKGLNIRFGLAPAINDY